VTVGIPFLDPGPALAEAVRSVFAQTFPDWALVLVDDGSRDGSVERARAIRDPRVTVLADGQHRGLVARLNQLAQSAEAPLLARMDADDLMHPERLARQVALFDSRPDLEVAGTGAYVMDGARHVLGRWSTAPLAGTVAEVLERGVLFIHPTVVYRTAFARAHPYEPSYPRAEDLALWCRIVDLARCAALEDPLLFYRVPIPVNLRSYAGTKSSTRAVLRDFGSALAPARRRALERKTHWSVWAYRVAGAVGAQRALVRRRARPVGPDERASAHAALRAIDATCVPGWD
jgi:glycosyltransferase involved in cell wall biosynthesis